VLTAQHRMCVTVGGALSETVATVSLRTKRMLIFRLRNKKCYETGPNRRCSGPEQYQKLFRFNLYSWPGDKTVPILQCCTPCGPE